MVTIITVTLCRWIPVGMCVCGWVIVCVCVCVCDRECVREKEKHDIAEEQGVVMVATQ